MKLFNIRLLFFCSFFLLASPCQPLVSAEEKPQIKDIIVTTSEVDLLLFATVKNGFTQEMLDGVNSGIPIVFAYQMKLVKTSNWLDTTLVEATVTHTLTFDEANKQYIVTFSDQNEKVVATQDIEEAKQLMAELNGVKVIELSQLIPDAPYAIRFKVILKKGSLPLGVHRLLPFSAIWNYETDWRTIEFRY